MSRGYDVLILGLGAMGSAAACHLARRGRRVLGLDRFVPPHTLGSSHGQTRIIREAYFEHPAYVPLVQRAYELWAELETETCRKLFLQTGGLMIGPADGVVVKGTRHSAELHHLPHEILTAAEVTRRFPALRPAPEMAAVWEPRAGVLFPEACISAHLELARRHGAEVLLNEPALNWEQDGEGIVVTTPRGEHQAARLLITAGPWLGALAPEWRAHLTVERQVQFWFAPADSAAHFSPERCPVHLWESAPGHFFYGFPDLGEGVKLAGHHAGEVTTPEEVRREVTAAEIEEMRQLAWRFVPGADGPLRHSAVCLYMNTPDGHFFLGHPPASERVFVASPCSGHGFKFAAALGEVLADWIEGRPPRFDLSLFQTPLAARKVGGLAPD